MDANGDPGMTTTDGDVEEFAAEYHEVTRVVSLAKCKLLITDVAVQSLARYCLQSARKPLGSPHPCAPVSAVRSCGTCPVKPQSDGGAQVWLASIQQLGQNGPRLQRPHTPR